LYKSYISSAWLVDWVLAIARDAFATTVPVNIKKPIITRENYNRIGCASIEQIEWGHPPDESSITIIGFFI
jgi:hypothetical protein